MISHASGTYLIPARPFLSIAVRLGLMLTALVPFDVLHAKASASLVLGNLNATYDGLPKVVSAAQPAVVTTVAGSISPVGGQPFFVQPYGVSFDASGNLFVVDGDADSLIWKITPAAVVSIFAGGGNLGYADGTGSAAQFLDPHGIAVDAAGLVYVGDSGNRVVRKITPDGVVTTLAGTAGVSGSVDGNGAAARFRYPNGVAVDGVGNVYIADALSCTIRKITVGGVVTTLAGSDYLNGFADGVGAAARFNFPTGLAVDSARNVYVADNGNHVIRKISAGGAVTTMAGAAGSFGSTDGTGNAARFHSPYSVAVDGSGNVFVADTGNDTIRKIASGNVVSTLAGAAGTPGSADGTGSAARFDLPAGLTSDNHGALYVADSRNHLIRKITGGSSTIEVTYNGSSVAPTAAGSYAVVATLNDPDFQGTASGTLVIAKAPQTITFASPSSPAAGTGSVALSALASSGLPVSFSVVSGPATITENLLTLSGPGPVTVRASQAGDGNFEAAVDVDRRVKVAGQTNAQRDFNGDEKSDILLSNAVTGDRAIWLMNGTLIETNAFAGTIPLAWVTSDTGDFDGDGKADILWTNTVTGDRAMWLMSGSVNVGGGYLGAVPLEWAVSGIGDFNGDGKADIVWTNTVTGERAVWLMNGSALSAGASLGIVPLAWVVSGTGDFNADGKTDILLSNTSTGDRVIWFMNGAAIGTNAFAGTVPVAWTAGGVGDFDGDGKVDIFWTNTTTGDRAVWLMNGGTNSAGGYLGQVPVEWVVSSAKGDYNGDGKSDIFWTNTATGERAIWLMNGITTSGGASLGVIPVAWVPAR